MVVQYTLIFDLSKKIIMSNYSINDRNKIKRVPKRGHYDQETVHEILDAAFVCHVGMTVDGQPFVIPCAYGREGDTIYLHGATSSRMMKYGEEGLPICVTVTHVDGIVLARSAFHHSMNYRSAVCFGTAKPLLTEEEKNHALKVVSDQILKGRWEESRLPNSKELKATTVLAMKIDQASAKIRVGGPSDDKPDYDLDIWAGVLPMEVVYKSPIADEVLRDDIPLAESVTGRLGSDR